MKEEELNLCNTTFQSKKKIRSVASNCCCQILHLISMFWTFCECFGLFVNVLDFSCLFWSFGLLQVFVNILGFLSIFWVFCQYFGLFVNILGFLFLAVFKNKLDHLKINLTILKNF
jgi:hypothetical protein